MKMWPFSALAEEMSLTAETNEHRADQIFSEAKKLSDFIGMIVRLAFTLFAFHFFMLKAPQIGGLTGFVFGISAINAFGLSVVLANKIMRIIYYWEMIAVAKAQSRHFRALLLFFALCSTLVAYYGIFKMAFAIAKSSPIIAAT